MRIVKGLFLVLEGISGSGKSTLLENLCASGDWTQVTTITTELEGLLEAVDRTTSAHNHMGFWLALQYALRARIEPLIDSGVNVVLDSYIYRTIASHAVLLEGLPPTIDWTLALRPDLALWLDVEEGERTRRLAGRDACVHKSPWHRAVNTRQVEVRRNYANFFDDLVRLDTTGLSANAVFEQASTLITQVRSGRHSSQSKLSTSGTAQPWRIRDDSRPLVISFSGIDGAGKTTTAKRVAQALQHEGVGAEYAVPKYRNLETVRAHCARCFGSRYAYATQLTGDFYLSALTLDWIAWLERDVPAGDRNIILCTDRYLPDVLAQGVRHGASSGWLREIISRLPRADISYFLNVTPDVAGRRLDARCDEPRNAVETQAALHLLYAGLIDASHSYSMVNIDGQLDEEAVFQSVMTDLRHKGLCPMVAASDL